MKKICKIALFVLCAQAYSAQAASWQEFGQAVNEVSDGVEKLANNYKNIKAENQNCATDKTKLAQDAQAQIAQAKQAEQDAQTQLTQAQQDAQAQIALLTQEKTVNSEGLNNAIEKIKAVNITVQDALKGEVVSDGDNESTSSKSNM